KKHRVGVVARPGDDVNFAQNIIALLRQPQLLARLKKNALRSSRLLSWRQSCTHLSRVYLRLVQQGKRHD
ncbi:MAG: hypothetical protein G01um1014106_477, partial [Parcubacteria group bacterium Gr01-1014_106]